MEIINPNFVKQEKKYVLKCVVIFFAILLMLLSLNHIAKSAILGVIGASSLASSIFIVLALPNSPVARPKCMILAYIIGISIGVLFYYLGTFLSNEAYHLPFTLSYELSGAFCVVLTMLLMIILNVEHPPATGLALGLVIDAWSYSTILIIMAIIIIVAIIKKIVDNKICSS